jgi:hypothetical protein
MTRSRLAVLVSMTIVGVGVLVGLGALWLDPARAAVGPLPGEALILPAEARFVMGLDVKRFTSSPFYERYASRRGMQPEGLVELEERTGLNPARDIDEIVVAGTAQADRGPGLVLALGRFDLYKLGRAIETGGGEGHRVEGVTVYSFTNPAPVSHEEKGRPRAETSGPADREEPVRRTLALALLDERALLFGPRDQVESATASFVRGEAPLRKNAPLVALVEKVRPGSTFWMAGDQSLLARMPSSVPAPGGGPDASISLPALRSLTVTGDLEPDVSLAITGEAADEPAAKNLADVVRGFVALMSLQARQKPELQQLTSAVTVATEANRVLVSARLPYEVIDALQAKPRPAASEAQP